MLTLLENLPDNVLGVEATGEVTGDDYRQTLIPAFEEHRAKYGKVRLLCVLGDQYEGYSASGMWEDEKLGWHLFSWEKIAIATDSSSFRRAVKAVGWMIPGSVKLFTASEVEQAKDWVAA